MGIQLWFAGVSGNCCEGYIFFLFSFLVLLFYLMRKSTVTISTKESRGNGNYVQ